MLLLTTQLLLQVDDPQQTLFTVAVVPSVIVAELVDLTHADATAFCANVIVPELLVRLPVTVAA